MTASRRVHYEVQGRYSELYGWELVTAEDTLAEARDRKREYQANEPGTRFRVKRIVEKENRHE